MRAARRSRRYGIAAASLVGHAVLAILLVLHAPRLRIPEPASGPPEAIIPVLIMPRTPPPAAQPGAKPTPVQLHRRPQRFADDELPIKPLIAPAPEPTVERPAPAPGPRTLTLPGQDDALAANARKALRGRLGCANAGALGLSRAEREACEDQLATGQADFPGLGVDANKASGLAAAAARRERDYKYLRAAPPPAWNAAPAGASARDLGKIVGSDNVEKKVPF